MLGQCNVLRIDAPGELVANHGYCPQLLLVKTESTDDLTEAVCHVEFVHVSALVRQVRRFYRFRLKPMAAGHRNEIRGN